MINNTTEKAQTLPSNAGYGFGIDYKAMICDWVVLCIVLVNMKV